ncbi:hypothetical protein G9A89_016277 [Geosiphon pyriformis]|nr:hypothetical protein G9A89_016277 [Geosiphon pyriformis]
MKQLYVYSEIQNVGIKASDQLVLYQKIEQKLWRGVVFMRKKSPGLNLIENLCAIVKRNSEYSKVIELVKNILARNQKTPEDLFDCLNEKNSQSLIDTFGQFILGCCHDIGFGTSQDQGKAFEHYSKAAEAGDIGAQYSLAVYYANDKGTTKNLEKAFELYSKAAEAGYTTAETGHTSAQYNLALCYANGKGTTKNSDKAFELYSNAAEAGNLKAQYNLALSAEAGYKDAQYNLALCYQNGWGTTENLAKALKLYLKTAKAGNTIAKINLGLCLRSGNFNNIFL